MLWLAVAIILIIFMVAALATVVSFVVGIALCLAAGILIWKLIKWLLAATAGEHYRRKLLSPHNLALPSKQPAIIRKPLPLILSIIAFSLGCWLLSLPTYRPPPSKYVEKPSVPSVPREPPVRLEPAEEVTTLRISARRSWTDIGIDLKEREEILIVAKGTWDGSGSDAPKPDLPCGPEGIVPPKWVEDLSPYPYHGGRIHELLGKIGGGEPFYVGRKYQGIVKTAGRLYLGINDWRVSDNDGYLDVRIEVEATGETLPKERVSLEPKRERKAVSNIALGKPVSVATNGARDSLSCAGDSPSDITDGSLDYRPASDGVEDGCVGWANGDYNELMVITITIDLQGIYNISKIRYNPGNCQRAETWNADIMESPFGRTPTNPGSSYRGAWTEQTGNITTSEVTIKLEKTRRSYATDWLFVGEIEVLGTPVEEEIETEEPEVLTPKPAGQITEPSGPQDLVKQRITTSAVFENELLKVELVLIEKLRDGKIRLNLVHTNKTNHSVYIFLPTAKESVYLADNLGNQYAYTDINNVPTSGYDFPGSRTNTKELAPDIPVKGSITFPELKETATIFNLVSKYGVYTSSFNPFGRPGEYDIGYAQKGKTFNMILKNIKLEEQTKE